MAIPAVAIRLSAFCEGFLNPSCGTGARVGVHAKPSTLCVAVPVSQGARAHAAGALPVRGLQRRQGGPSEAGWSDLARAPKNFLPAGAQSSAIIRATWSLQASLTGGVHETGRQWPTRREHRFRYGVGRRPREVFRAAHSPPLQTDARRNPKTARLQGEPANQRLQPSASGTSGPPRLKRGRWPDRKVGQSFWPKGRLS